MPIKPTRIINISSDDSRSSIDPILRETEKRVFASELQKHITSKFDKMNAMVKTTTNSFFEWIGKPATKTQNIILYHPIYTIEYDLLRLAHFARFVYMKDVRFIHLYSNLQYSKKLALAYAGNSPSCIIRCSLNEDLFNKCQMQKYKISDQNGWSYMVPMQELTKVNESLVGPLSIDQIVFDKKADIYYGDD